MTSNGHRHRGKRQSLLSPVYITCETIHAEPFRFSLQKCGSITTATCPWHNKVGRIPNAHTYMENRGYAAEFPPRQRQLSPASGSSIVMRTSRVNNTTQNIINVQGFLINLNCHSQNKHPHAHQRHHHKNLPVTFVVAR